MWRRRCEPLPALVEVTPSRWDADPVARARAAFAGLAGTTGIAFEVVAETGRVRFFVRARDTTTLDLAIAQLRAHAPQARLQSVDLTARCDDDPVRPGVGEAAASYELRLARSPSLPLASGGSLGPRRREPEVNADLLGGVLATAAHAESGLRVVLQLVLGRGAEGWGPRLAVEAAEACPGWQQRPAPAADAGLLPALALFALGTLGLRAYRWYREGQLLPLLALGLCGAAALPLLTLVATRLRRHAWPVQELVREKLGAPAMVVHVRVAALGAADRAVLQTLAERVAGTLRAFDHPAGNALRPHAWRGDPTNLTIPCGPFRRPDVLTAAELAGLWHLPDTVRPELVAARSRWLFPPDGVYARGCRVGVVRHQGLERVVHLSTRLLFRNHLIVAKTRRGKSTLLLQMARFLMERLAAGHERLALVVIDPHQDLAEAVLSAVPDSLEDRVSYLNLADRDRPVGINLLDPDLFPDRDRTAENVVTMLHRLWPDNWGPRMEGALRASALALHEANQVRPPAARYTLLDVMPFLASAALRAEVLGQVQDLALHAWWEDTYERLGRVLQQQIANPITTKIGRFLVGEASRMTLGQPCSTFDPRALLQTGGVLVVNAAVGRLGEGGAALLGATVLNLLALVVEEQVAVPPGRRTRVIALVDESSTLGAADYPRMLSELGKYGLSVVLVTQSLAKLDAIDRQLRPTILANVDALTVFQVSAEDARILTPEMGPELALEDLTDLDDYACYARWWADGQRPAAFSVQIDAPQHIDQQRMRRIAARSAQRHGRPRGAVLAEIDAVIRLRQERRPDGPGAESSPGGEPTEGTARDGNTTRDAGSAARPTSWSGPVAAKPKQGRRSHARSNAQKRLFE